MCQTVIYECTYRAKCSLNLQNIPAHTAWPTCVDLVLLFLVVCKFLTLQRSDEMKGFYWHTVCQGPHVRLGCNSAATSTSLWNSAPFPVPVTMEIMFCFLQGLCSVGSSASKWRPWIQHTALFYLKDLVSLEYPQCLCCSIWFFAENFKN